MTTGGERPTVDAMAAATPPPADREALIHRIIDSAAAMGIEIDRLEAEDWISAMETESIGGRIQVDVDTGVYGHKVTMADYSPADLARFRAMAPIVGIPDAPPQVTTALALSGSAAQSKIQRFPADADFFERDLAYSRFDEDFSQTSQELRLLSPTGGALEYVAGVYWHHNDLLEFRTTATTFAPAGNTIRFFDQGSSTVSAYTQATWNVSPQFAAVLGLRYTKEDKDASYIRIGGATSTTTGVGTVQASFADTVSEGEVDPALSLQWRPDGDHMIYGSYSQGSKSGGFQGGVSNATPAAFKFKPEKSDSLEFGYKQSYGGKGYLDVVLFHTKYQDLQSSTALPTTASGSSFAFFTGNAGEATAQGIETNWAYRFSEHVKVNAALAYMDAKYGQYAEGPCITGQTPNNAARGSCDNSNIDLPFSSKWSGNVTASWNSDLGSSIKLDVSVTANFRSSFRAEFAPDPLFVEGGYTKYDARIGLSFGDSWELALLGRNLTDKKTFSFATAAALANNPALGISPDARLGVVDPPRTVALQARYKFQ